MPGHCAFCGRRHEDCPGGLWHLNFPRPRHPGDAAICVYCTRQANRALDPDAPSAEPVPIFARRPQLDPPDSAA
jgi:hypothetical protein